MASPRAGGESRSESAPRSSEMNPVENAVQADTLTGPSWVPPHPTPIPILYSGKILPSASLAKAMFTIHGHQMSHEL